MPFKGRVSAIHAGSFFHLFNDDQQIELLKRCAKLLSEGKGSIIIGRQLGSKDPRNLRGDTFYVHSPQSWETVCKEVFQGTAIKYRAELVSFIKDLEPQVSPKYQEIASAWTITEYLIWSVEIV